MQKTTLWKRVISFVLALVMVIGYLPSLATEADAATSAIGDIGLSWTDHSGKGSSNWTVSGTTVTGTAKGYYASWSGKTVSNITIAYYP